MVGIATTEDVIFTPRRLSSALEPLCINITKSSREAVINRLMEPASIARSMAWALDAEAERMVRSVYVFGVEGYPVSKIGYSDNPLKRWRNLRQSLWAEVHVAALFWSIPHPATLIEGYALNLAAARDLRLRGEWVNLPPRETVGLVLDSFDPVNPFADAATFLSNWVPQLNATLLE